MDKDNFKKSAAIVFGAQHPTGLITARSLRDCDLDIIGIAFSDSPCLRSNLWTALTIAEKNTIDLLTKLEIFANAGYSELLLFPADDDCVKILSDNRHKLPPSCKLMLPDQATVDLLLDKSLFYTWAQQRGLHVPATAKVSGFEELDKVVAEIGYPLLLKPLYRNLVWDNEFPLDKLFIIENQQQRNSLPEKLFRVASPILLQQWIPGGDDQVYFCLVQYSAEGKLMNQYCGRKLMQWPPLGGSTAIAVTDSLEEVRDMTVAVFDAVGYQGLGSMEYKKDPRNGKFYIMEPTVGRNDLQSYLAVSGGVNLTRAVCRELQAKAPENYLHKKFATWFCEPSVGYGAKYYLRNRNFYLLKHFFKLFGKPGFAYLSGIDKTPFLELVKNRLR